LKRVIVFIDGNNLFHRTWDYYHTHLINIEVLSRTLCNINRELKQIRYYYSPFIREVNARSAHLQQTYVENISKIPNIHVCIGKYIKKPVSLKKEVFDKIKNNISPGDLSGYVEKGIDVQIAVDMISMGIRKEYDTAILVGTDSDYVPIVRSLQDLKIKVQVAAFQDSEHSCYDLKNCCKSFINMHHIVPSILKKQKSRP
ncbi:MAG: NYN domain-containing protein, partial [Candidatus Omnitrophota bacterium]|nr:NYN domain-containing protein [Candidatus Omnitrophota bacterium]